MSAIVEYNKSEFNEFIKRCYQDKKPKDCKNACKFRLAQIKAFIESTKSWLHIDIAEHIISYLRPVRKDVDCFNHIKNYDCVNYNIYGDKFYDRYKNIYPDPEKVTTNIQIYRVLSIYNDYLDNGRPLFFAEILGDNRVVSYVYMSRSSLTKIENEVGCDYALDYNFKENEVYIMFKRGIRQFYSRDEGREYTFSIIECRKK